MNMGSSDESIRSRSKSQTKNKKTGERQYLFEVGDKDDAEYIEDLVFEKSDKKKNKTEDDKTTIRQMYLKNLKE
jgi:hypothetical protein